jgi:YceI-like protein
MEELVAGAAYVAMTLAASGSEPGVATHVATPARASIWQRPGLIQPGSIVGYRVRERFVQLQSPHEAVARTERVSGWVLALQSGTGIQIDTGCVAVDVATLKSVDSIPGYGTNGRDQIYTTLFETSRYPYVIFQPYAIALPSLSVGQTVHAVVPGVLEIRGSARSAKFTLDVRRPSDQVAVAGTAQVNADEFGVHVLEGPDGWLSVDPHCTLEVSLKLVKA